MAIPWEGIGILLAAFVAALAKSGYNGKVRQHVDKARQKQRSAQDAHESIPEVVDTIEDIQETVENVDEKVDNLHTGQLEVKETVAYLHRQELNDDPLARNRLGVAVDDDIIQDE